MSAGIEEKRREQRYRGLVLQSLFDGRIFPYGEIPDVVMQVKLIVNVKEWKTKVTFDIFDGRLLF